MFESTAPHRTVITLHVGGIWTFGAARAVLLNQSEDLESVTGFPVTLVVMLTTGWLLGLYALMTYTRAATLLGETGWRQILWMIAVLCGGAFVARLSWEVAYVIRPDLGRNTLLLALLGGISLALAAGVLLCDRRVRTAMVALTGLLLGACTVVLFVVPPDSLERRLADRNIDRETAYAIIVPGYTPWLDRSFAHPGDDTRYTNGRVDGINLEVTGDAACPAVATCTPEGPDLTYLRMKSFHGYAVRRGQVNVQVVSIESVDRALLRRAVLSAHTATDDELLRALPPWRPTDIFDRVHQQLHAFLRD